MAKVTKTQTLRAAKKLGVNMDIINLDTLHKGLLVELEHGRRSGITNVTNDSILVTLKITCAHLEEFPDYYEELDKLEEKLTKRWRGKKRPSIFL